MEEIKLKIQTILNLIGFDKAQIEGDKENTRISVFIKDRGVSPSRLPEVVSSLTHLFRQVIGRDSSIHILVDVNDYRKEREELIIKIARAAAKKAAVTKSSVPLPSMNAYERLVVHTELSMNPNIKTVSEGEARERHVVVSPAEF